MNSIKNRIALFIVLFFSLGFVLFPIYWTINTALKQERDIVKLPVKYLPNPATLENFAIAWNNVGFSKYFFNSVYISGVSVIIIVIFSILTGYALSRYNFKGKSVFLFALLVTQFIPVAVLLIPLFNIFNTFNLIGSRLSIILANITFQLPFNAVLMRGFVSSIPYEMEESAMVDGCNRMQSITKIVIPMLKPGIISVAAFAFIGCWNEFLFSLMFLNDPARFTIPIGLRFMQGQFDINYGSLAAGALIAMSIPVLLFAYLQKHLVHGITAGGVKG